MMGAGVLLGFRDELCESGRRYQSGRTAASLRAQRSNPDQRPALDCLRRSAPRQWRDLTTEARSGPSCSGEQAHYPPRPMKVGGAPPANHDRRRRLVLPRMIFGMIEASAIRIPRRRAPCRLQLWNRTHRRRQSLPMPAGSRVGWEDGSLAGRGGICSWPGGAFLVGGVWPVPGSSSSATTFGRATAISRCAGAKRTPRQGAFAMSSGDRPDNWPLKSGRSAGSAPSGNLILAARSGIRAGWAWHRSRHGTCGRLLACPSSPAESNGHEMKLQRSGRGPSAVDDRRKRRRSRTMVGR